MLKNPRIMMLDTDWAVEGDDAPTIEQKFLGEVRCDFGHLLAKNVTSGEFLCPRCPRPKKTFIVVYGGEITERRPLDPKAEEF